LNIPLWRAFHSKYGVELSEVNFWVDLSKITGLEPPDAQKLEGDVRKAYITDTQGITVEKKKGDEMKDRAEGIEVIEIKAGLYNQKLPFTEDGIEVAKSFLDLLKNQIKSRGEEKELMDEEEETSEGT